MKYKQSIYRYTQLPGQAESQSQGRIVFIIFYCVYCLSGHPAFFRQFLLGDPQAFRSSLILFNISATMPFLKK